MPKKKWEVAHDVVTNHCLDDEHKSLTGKQDVMLVFHTPAGRIVDLMVDANNSFTVYIREADDHQGLNAEELYSEWVAPCSNQWEVQP